MCLCPVQGMDSMHMPVVLAYNFHHLSDQEHAFSWLFVLSTC